ncbi:hypothetical protein ACFSUM_01400 [Virgibacillus siamensis]|uniref:hypothetical protein n=1 Tax=Virgibacillus siamensis TaxID=480071 RepID=UPI0031CEBD30
MIFFKSAVKAAARSVSGTPLKKSRKPPKKGRNPPKKGRKPPKKSRKPPKKNSTPPVKVLQHLLFRFTVDNCPATVEVSGLCLIIG